MTNRSTGPNFYAKFGKRWFDVVCGIIILAVASPILIVLLVAQYVTIGAPVIFRHTRPGRHGALFTMYKFRTMTNDRDASGEFLPDDMRITNVGRVVRGMSLDELPEIFNVIKGDMSLVGPRPLLVEYLPRYSPEQARRHEVRPGITGWAQINGRNAITWEEKFVFDVWYVDRVSFTLDIRILAMTLWKVVRREGISEEGFVSASFFMGSEPGGHSNDQSARNG